MRFLIEISIINYLVLSKGSSKVEVFMKEEKEENALKSVDERYPLSLQAISLNYSAINILQEEGKLFAFSYKSVNPRIYFGALRINEIKPGLHFAEGEFETGGLRPNVIKLLISNKIYLIDHYRYGDRNAFLIINDRGEIRILIYTSEGFEVYNMYDFVVKREYRDIIILKKLLTTLFCVSYGLLSIIYNKRSLSDSMNSLINFTREILEEKGLEKKIQKDDAEDLHDQIREKYNALKAIIHRRKLDELINLLARLSKENTKKITYNELIARILHYFLDYLRSNFSRRYTIVDLFNIINNSAEYIFLLLRHKEKNYESYELHMIKKINGLEKMSEPIRHKADLIEKRQINKSIIVPLGRYIFSDIRLEARNTIDAVTNKILMLFSEINHLSEGDRETHIIAYYISLSGIDRFKLTPIKIHINNGEILFYCENNGKRILNIKRVNNRTFFVLFINDESGNELEIMFPLEYNLIIIPKYLYIFTNYIEHEKEKDRFLFIPLSENLLISRGKFVQVNSIK